MRILYLDCFCGISGDMTLASLVDAGADSSYILSELDKIQIEPITLEWKRVLKCGISALKLNVIVNPAHQSNHHRHYKEIVNLIKKAGLTPSVEKNSLAIFEKIALAESKIHNIPLEKVHFHEVGAIDSIVDIIGISLALESLEVDQIYASPISVGSGFIRCHHGIYPVPAPATLEMLKGIPVCRSDHKIELTTPTGAAVISALVNDFSTGIPNMVIESIGYGAGTYDLLKHPNVLRVIIGLNKLL